MNPFVLMPWQKPFLPALLDYALTVTAGDIGRAVFIFPHARPARYLQDLIAADPRVSKPCLLPRMLPVSLLFRELRARNGMPAPHIGLLDQVALLLRCVRAIKKEDPEFASGLPLDEPTRFFPWGVRLAGLMEEFFSQAVSPADYAHTEGEVAPFAAALLSRLASIHSRYSAALEEHAWSTPGYDALLAAGNPEPFRAAQDGEAVFLSGFHSLNGCEERVFKRLWQQGAHVCLHADPHLVEKGKKPHWSCSAFSQWAQRWGTRLVLFDPLSGELEPLGSSRAGEVKRMGASGRPYGHAPNQQSGRRQAEKPGAPAGTNRPAGPALHCVAGFDLHSQLDALAEDMQRLSGPAGSPASTAVILPDAGLLLPVLHHLPAADINISMGYPLARSSLFRLLESILRLQETRNAAGLYHWKEAVDLFRHPYLKMLEPEPAAIPDGPEAGSASPAGSGAEQRLETPEPGRNKEKRTLREVLQTFEQALRRGRRYVDLRQAAEELCASCRAASAATSGLHSGERSPEEPSLNLFTRVLRVAVTAWEKTATPQETAKALEALVSLLLEHGGGLWKRFPIDAECLYRLMQSIIPQLAHSMLGEEGLDRETLFSVLRRLLEAERAPFEADPLVGLQVLGMLETRLLSFERVFILDATEDALPGSSSHDPLLPDSLRPATGLPNAGSRERVAAYNFFRLLAGADSIFLYWQEGIEPQGLADGKKLRSRFIEELLWQVEQQEGCLLQPRRRELFRSRVEKEEKPDSLGEPDGPRPGNSGPLEAIACTLPPLFPERRIIPATPAVRARMASLLRSPISPSLLDAYMTCPARFFHERLAGLHEVESAQEGDDPREVGAFLHGVLLEYFSTRLGRPVEAGKEEKAALGLLLQRHLETSELAFSLPTDSRIMLEESGPLRLGAMLERQAEQESIPLLLEHPFSAPLDTSRGKRVLHGILDRLDQRGETVCILDYKTGALAKPAASFWQDEALWEFITAFDPTQAAPEEFRVFLETLAKACGSVQLPCYLFLQRQAASSLIPPAGDAAFVALADQGQEHFLFDAETCPQDRAAAMERIPLLLTGLISHMEFAPAFFPRPDRHCDWCSCKTSCKIFSVM